MFLGLCLIACGLRREARHELLGGLRGSALDFDVRDRAVRALLQLDVADFEERFAKAADRAQRGRSPRSCLAEFQLWLKLQPEFWPALFFTGVAKRRAGDTEDALDLFAAALEISPGQPDVLFEMAELFAARQNCKRALELVDMALPTRSHEPRFHAAKARYLHGLGRTAEAKVCLQLAFKVGLDSPDLRKVGRLLRRSRP